jgi:putative endonuclease
MLRRLYEIADILRHHARARSVHPTLALGRRGEDLAHRFLQRAGFAIVARNYRTASGSGEIDLIGWEGETLVVVEVKSRQTDEYGTPDRAIGSEKEMALIRAAREFTRHANVPWERVRFDVVTVVFGGAPQLSHFRDVFRPS